MGFDAQVDGWGPQATGPAGGGDSTDALIPDAAIWYADDDGIGTAGNFQSVSASAGSLTAMADDNQAPQSSRIGAGTTAAGRCARTYRGSNLNYLDIAQLPSGGAFEWRASYLSKDAAPDATDNWSCAGGFIDAVNATDSTDGAYFVLVPAFGSTVVVCKTAGGGARTPTTTAITLPTTNAGKYDFRIVLTATAAKFYYRDSLGDGTWTLLATHTTDVPVAGERFGAGLAVVGTASGGVSVNRAIRYAIQTVYMLRTEPTA